MAELDLIRSIRERTKPVAGVRTGIGDDAAVLSWDGHGEVVVSTDLVAEGVHFETREDPAAVAYKAIAVSVSDLAAMGCRSLAAVLAVALPREGGEELARALLAGALDAAERLGTPLVGGDTTESRSGLVLCSTVFGAPPPGSPPVLRSGAAPGERVLVTGRLGGSRRGRHLRFIPRQAEALELVATARPGAMIDLSDGLSSDAWHLARESRVALRLRAADLPVHPDAGRGPGALAAALGDGEDFELLFTVDPGSASRLTARGLAGTPVTEIGEVLSGEPAVTIVDPQGQEEELRAGGYEHLR